MLCVVTSVTLLGLSGGGAVAIPSQCEALKEIVPATIGAITGDVTGAPRHARTLRDLSTRELVPQRIKPALRKLARFFERAPDFSILERARAIGSIARPLSKIVVYSAQVCTESLTPPTTRPLR